MMHQPRVSFVIPAFNAEATLERAVVSVLDQRGAQFEVVVIDDGSTDGTRTVADRIAATYSEVRVEGQPNGGAASALNRGRQMANGEFVCSVDADDELTPDYLTTMWGFVNEHPGYGFYSHDLWRVNEQGERERVFGWDEVRELTLDDFLSVPTVVGPGTLWRTEVIDSLGGYKEGIYNEDYDLWLRALSRGVKHIYCPAVLYCYYQHSGQKTADRVRVHDSVAQLLEEATLGGALTDEQVGRVRESIAENRRLANEYRVYGQPLAVLIGNRSEADAAALRGTLERSLPPVMVGPVLRVIHGLSWVSRPVRRMIWKVQARRRNSNERDKVS